MGFGLDDDFLLESTIRLGRVSVDGHFGSLWLGHARHSAGAVGFVLDGHVVLPMYAGRFVRAV